MNKPEYIDLTEYHYELDEERIARYPLPERDGSKLLLYKEGRVRDTLFRELPSLLPKNTSLVFNDTRVIHARLVFYKPTGARIEVFCLQPVSPAEYSVSFSKKERVTWKCMIGNARKWTDSELKLTTRDKTELCARKTCNPGEIEFYWNPTHLSFSEVLEVFGKTPIPPYLKRDAEEEDSIRYQTVYSKREGSVAAPTAGLHFTTGVFKELDRLGIPRFFLTLHVGAGTFIPVKTRDATRHKMHIEHISLSRDQLKDILSRPNFIIPVGTTSCRTLESLYWLGVKHLESIHPLNHLEQWEAFRLTKSYSRTEALEAILNKMEGEEAERFEASTGIMITPGYEFQMTDALITNFHQPSSTLLMLIAALTGDDWKKIYNFALKNDYRFLSYGDSSLLFRNKRK